MNKTPMHYHDGDTEFFETSSAVKILAKAIPITTLYKIGQFVRTRDHSTGSLVCSCHYMTNFNKIKMYEESSTPIYSADSKVFHEKTFIIIIVFFSKRLCMISNYRF